jgi:hypothetical protein
MDYHREHGLEVRTLQQCSLHAHSCFLTPAEQPYWLLKGLHRAGSVQ